MDGVDNKQRFLSDVFIFKNICAVAMVFLYEYCDSLL